jgi:predicted DNA-binding protein YlxM (UPF0122 family)
MEKFVEMSLLYDFYGKMLTDRQQDIVDLYYMKDLSLGEIAEYLNISRQAVHDNLRRAERQLRLIEQRLGLVDRFSEERDRWSRAIERINGIISEIETGSDRRAVRLLEEFKEFIFDNMGG